MARFRTFGPLLMTAGLLACSVEGTDGGASSGGTPEPDVKADLRADSNRDGEVRFDDESDAQKTEWDKTSGAVFLANIDDDNERCKSTGDDVTIAKCNDAQDEVVNGDDDALDLARLKSRPWPKTPEDATGHVAILTDAAKTMVRLFKKVGEGATDFEPLDEDNVFTREELQAGFELGIEAKDIVRDPAEWDGYVDVQLTVSSPTKGDSTDQVRLRVAPVLTFHHLLPAEQIWVSNTRTPGNSATRADLSVACKAAGIGVPQTIDVDDPWAQDFFEPAYTSMPAKDGTQHVMRVNYRSANVFEPGKTKSPLRPAGQLVFKLRGRDVAGVQQFDIRHSPDMDTLNSFGNLETVPPYEKDGVSFPFGRVVRGKTKSYYPDKTFEAMIAAQGQQPEIAVDTSWLLVAHIDETISFVKAPTPRGWMLLVNDAPLAKKLLEDAVQAGKGDTPMFVGKSWFDFENNKETPAEITIADVLADTEVMKASAEAAAEVDAQLAILKAETGLTDDEIVHVPFLHINYDGKSAAYQPGTVNGVYISDTRFGAPDPHGPEIDGKDIFKTALSEPLAKLGITVDFIEDWDEYHLGIGEVHCGTNATRAIPAERWWESGR
ncbi:MAG: Protein-arginine deiminase type [Labilithrix sp.]|nr:Protein-arginine deiminase type [Labilithrix sp.]